MHEAEFTQFRPMVEKFAWKAAREYRIEIEEVRGQAYLIFSETMIKYDPRKGSLSTYLHHNLRQLGNHCLRCTRRSVVEKAQSSDYFDGHSALRYSSAKESLDRLEDALDLSGDAQAVLDFVISRDWEVPGTNLVPRFSAIRRWFEWSEGWKYRRTKLAWDEIRAWWRSYRHPFKEM